MNKGLKIEWTKPKNKNKGYVASKYERIYLVTIIIISALSAWTEFISFSNLFDNHYLGFLASFTIEFIIHLLFSTSALMLFLCFHDKDSWKSYFLLFVLSALAGVCLFLISRSYSQEGAEIKVVDWTEKPAIVEVDKTSYNLTKESINLSKKSDIDNVNVLYAKELQSTIKPLFEDKKRKKSLNIKYGLNSIDYHISQYKGSSIEWKKNTYVILKKEKKKLQAILKTSKASNKESKLIALKEIESKYNKQLSSNDSGLASLVTSVNESNATNNSNYESKVSSRQSKAYYAIWGILGFGVLLHYIFYMGKLWSGSTPEYKEKHSTEWLSLIINSALFANLKMFNFFNTKFTNVSKGKGIIEKHQFDLETKESQEEEQIETQGTGKQEHGNNVIKLNPRTNTNIDKQLIVSQGIKQDVSYRELIRLIVKEYAHIEEQAIREIASKVQGFDVPKLKKNTRNFHKRDGDYNGIKYILAEYRLREAGYQVDIVNSQSLEIEQKYVV